MVIIQLSEDQLKELITKAVVSALAVKIPVINEELICRKDTASYLKVTLPTLRTWEQKGYLKPVRIGNRVFFKKSDLIGPVKS